MGEYEYTTREVWVDDDGSRIYGVAYVPETPEPAPLVVLAHEFGADHKTGTKYAKALAEHGYAAYSFDFRGGTVGGNLSDGATTEMSVMTEVADLATVMKAARGWDFVDSSRIAVLGRSQGGCVAAAYAAAHPDAIDGLILLYPALSIHDDVRAMFATPEDIPETYSLFDGWITVGRVYALDMWDYDPLERIGAYPGRVLIVHGDDDQMVDVSYSRRAALAYPATELHVIEGAGHGFRGAAFERACELVLDYLRGIWA